MHYYKFSITDYRKDTGHLTLLEHGIYRQMLDLYYLEERPLISDKAKLMRLVCVRSADEEKAFENLLNDYFTLTDNGYEHKKCERQLQEIYAKSEKARNSAKARWSKDANAMRTQCEPYADDMLPINPLTHKPTIKKHSAERFDEWWRTYPKKTGKKKTLEIWKRRKLDEKADDLIADITSRLANDRKWIDGYIPNPSTYLNGDRWEDEMETRGKYNAGHQQTSTAGRKLSVAERATEARKQWERDNPNG